MPIRLIADSTKERRTIMKRVIIAITCSLALTGTSLSWAASGQDKAVPDPKIGTRVIITGCLHKGTSGSFVLLGVTERPADPAAPIQAVPYAIYWLDSTDGLKALVGEMVDITGKVTGRRPKPGTITVSVDPSETKSTEVAVASGSKTLDATTKKFEDTPRPAGTSGAESSLEVTRPVYKLDVENVRAVSAPGGPACR
jgi:hypothetical protein